MSLNIVSRFSGLLLWIAVGVTGLLVISCSSTEPPANESEGSSGPEIKFRIPGEFESGGVGLSGEFLCPVLVEVTNFNLVDKLGEPNVPGEGHIHYYLDTELKSGSESIPEPDDSTFGDTSDKYYYWNDIGSGAHIFIAELVNNDHTPLDPPVIAVAGINTENFWDG